MLKFLIVANHMIDDVLINTDNINLNEKIRKWIYSSNSLLRINLKEIIIKEGQVIHVNGIKWTN